MNIYKMTIEEYKNMLEQEEYKAVNYPVHSYGDMFEMLMDYGDITSLFDDLVDELGRVPSQQEYINAGIERAKLFFTPRKDFGNGNIKYGDITKGRTLTVGKKQYQRSHTFYWHEEELQKAVKKRLSRTYPSLLVEVGVIIYMRELFPDLVTAVSPEIDIILGVDAVAIDLKKDKAIYIHVTGASGGGTNFLNAKKNRWGYAKDANGKGHFYERKSNRGHIHIAYSKFNEDATTQIINGNPVIKEEHLKNIIEVAFQQTAVDSAIGLEGLAQLRDLHNWLVEEKIKSEGLGQNLYVMSINHHKKELAEAK